MSNGAPLHSTPHAVRLKPKGRRGQCGVLSVLLPPTQPATQERDVTNVVPPPLPFESRRKCCFDPNLSFTGLSSVLVLSSLRARALFRKGKVEKLYVWPFGHLLIDKLDDAHSLLMVKNWFPVRKVFRALLFAARNIGGSLLSNNCESTEFCFQPRPNF